MSLPWKLVGDHRDVAILSSRGRDVTVSVFPVRRRGTRDLEWSWRIEVEDRDTFVAVGTAPTAYEARRRAEADLLLWQMGII